MFITLIKLVNYPPLETQNHYNTLLSVTNIFKFIKTQTVKYLDLKINGLGPFLK